MIPNWPDPLRRILDGLTIQPVLTGRSGATVFRFDTGLFLKITPVSKDPDPGASLLTEAEKLKWMRAAGAPVAEVLEALSVDGVEYLLTRAVPGVDASQLPSVDDSVGGAIARALKQLHGLPIAGCPFDQSLDRKIPQAFHRLEQGLVDLDDLDGEREGWDAARLRRSLEETRPQTEDLVLCHGDLCLPNVLLAGGVVTGFVDVGRAGIADRWQDLALMLRSLDSADNPQFDGCAEAFLRSYGVGPDRDRQQFYCLLDEFF